jgi:hypothetical protein
MTRAVKTRQTIARMLCDIGKRVERRKILAITNVSELLLEPAMPGYTIKTSGFIQNAYGN